MNEPQENKQAETSATKVSKAMNALSHSLELLSDRIGELEGRVQDLEFVSEGMWEHDE